MTIALPPQSAKRTTTNHKSPLDCPVQPQTDTPHSPKRSQPKVLPTEGTWQNLKERFLQHLDSRSTTTDWHQIWRLFVEHPWYQSQLADCATWVLQSGKAPSQWLDDLRQDAILLLARTLRRRVDLGIDRCRANEKFSAWLRTIIVRDCREALRRMRRLHQRETPLPSQPPTLDQQEQLDKQIDLRMAIDALATPDRTLVTLYLHGYSVKEIARRRQRNYASTYYQLRRVLASFRGKVKKLGIFTSTTQEGSASER